MRAAWRPPRLRREAFQSRPGKRVPSSPRVRRRCSAAFPSTPSAVRSRVRLGCSRCCRRLPGQPAGNPSAGTTRADTSRQCVVAPECRLCRFLPSVFTRKPRAVHLLYVVTTLGDLFHEGVPCSGPFVWRRSPSRDSRVLTDGPTRRQTLVLGRHEKARFQCRVKRPGAARGAGRTLSQLRARRLPGPSACPRAPGVTANTLASASGRSPKGSVCVGLRTAQEFSLAFIVKGHLKMMLPQQAREVGEPETSSSL